ncbi:MAG: AmmeMemoRadiSam system protein B [Phycisphaerales bacterium]
MTDQAPERVPEFDASKPHLQRPKLRPVRGFAAKAKDQEGREHDMLGLADARQISDRVVMVVPAAQLILPVMDGSRTLDQIISEVGRGLNRAILEGLVAQLDNACLLEGPTFNAMAEKMHAEFDANPNLPPASSAAFAEALRERNEDGTAKEEEVPPEVQADRFRQVIDQWIAEALKTVESPSLSTLPKAIVAPHLDYPRGWINYAATYGRLRVADRPDRVVILGTNHFGEATGICACDKGYQTPFGTCEVDRDLVDGLRLKLGNAAFANRFDHEREHSVELQVPWVQHVFGKDDKGNYPRVLGVLVHDPSVNNGASYDGKGVDLQPFVDTMKELIAKAPGRTLIVASADLSHKGPAFGDESPMNGEDEATKEARMKVFNHDREMLAHLAERKPWDLVASMAWQQNPTRWCSTGNLVAAMLIAEPSEVTIFNYSAAVDPQGMAMVSSVSMAMT